MQKRTKRIIVILVLVFASGAAAVTATFLLSSSEDDPAVARVKARGEAVMAEYAKRFEAEASPVPAHATPETEHEQPAYNASELCGQIAAILEDMRGQADYERFWDILLDKEWTEDNLCFLASFFRERADLMDDIRKLASLREPINRGDFADYGYPVPTYILPLNNMARLLAVEMAVQVREGNAEPAVENCLAILALSESLMEEPWLHSQKISYSVFSKAFWGVETFLPPGRLTHDQAKCIAQQLANSYGRDAFIQGLETEASLGVISIEAARKTGTNYWVGPNTQTVLGVVYRSPIGGAILNADRRHYAAFTERIIAAARLPYYEAYPQLEEIQDEIDELWMTNLFTLLAASSIAWKEPRDYACHEARVDLMRMGLLLEAHYSEHGAYPDSLEALAPELGGTVPVDPFTGESYQYLPEDGAFLLYSVGQDREDDGGFSDFYEGDMVWRGMARNE